VLCVQRRVAQFIVEPANLVFRALLRGDFKQDALRAVDFPVRIKHRGLHDVEEKRLAIFLMVFLQHLNPPAGLHDLRVMLGGLRDEWRFAGRKFLRELPRNCSGDWLRMRQK